MNPIKKKIELKQKIEQYEEDLNVHNESQEIFLSTEDRLSLELFAEKWRSMKLQTDGIVQKIINKRVLAQNCDLKKIQLNMEIVDFEKLIKVNNSELVKMEEDHNTRIQSLTAQYDIPFDTWEFDPDTGEIIKREPANDREQQTDRPKT